MIIPKLTRIDQINTHRLVPSKHGESVLTRIASNNEHLTNIFDLDNATNDRLLAENNLLIEISALELVSGFNYYRVVNAAFCHPQPEGSRFNSPKRGAWYASYYNRTAQQEIIFHKTLALAEINYFYDDVTYDNYLADFNYEFHDIRQSPKFKNCLHPSNYAASQKLASYLLLEEQSAGIVYPSVRDATGTNLVCFRPVLVNNVRKAKTYRFIWNGSKKPVVIAQ